MRAKLLSINKVMEKWVDANATRQSAAAKRYFYSGNLPGRTRSSDELYGIDERFMARPLPVRDNEAQMIEARNPAGSTKSVERHLTLHQHAKNQMHDAGNQEVGGLMLIR